MTYISHLHATCHHLISVRLILFSNSFLVSHSPSVCTINTNCWEYCKYRKMKHTHNKLYNLLNRPRIYRSWGNIILSDAINCIHTVNTLQRQKPVRADKQTCFFHAYYSGSQIFHRTLTFCKRYSCHITN